MIRVLIVDDSAFARKVLRESLSEVKGFDVVGFARDGLEALEMIAQLSPDVITLDLVMPNLDGLGLLDALAVSVAPPRVVVVSVANASSALAIEALAKGAFDVVAKPTAKASPVLYDLADELCEKVRAAFSSRMPRLQARSSEAPALVVPRSTRRTVAVIGTSTGGPPALTRVLSDLPADFPIPIAMVLHIPVGYTEALAARLDQLSLLHVVEASEGLVVTPGMAVLAQAGLHLRLERTRAGFVSRLSREPEMTHCPSVDVLFESVSSERAGALAVVLTGMGDDGLAASRLLFQAGASILTEAEASCVVFGMPRAVRDASLSEAEARIENMADLMVRSL